MKSGFVTALVLAGSVALAPQAGADCRADCTKLFRDCVKTCVANYSGIMRRGCKIGCKRAKKSVIRACRQNPQICAAE
ncbi:MAG TPA: hypothetical protein VMS22_20970 [Candidatus Eisenbacteria bacterium]|nr:hypothetical protein [Candidatus Eisenbacteria bacterium]